jgi:hypothetical protein
MKIYYVPCPHSEIEWHWWATTQCGHIVCAECRWQMDYMPVSYREGYLSKTGRKLIGEHRYKTFSWYEQ